MTWTDCLRVGVVCCVMGACSTGSVGTAPGDEPERESPFALVTYELRVQLPLCNWANLGHVYYVSSEERFYYCDGLRLRRIDLVGNPAGANWLTRLNEASTAGCPAGGVVIDVGPDTNGNGKLDSGEVVSSSAVCNGQDGRDGRDGEDGSSCTTYEDGEGDEVIECEDGTVVSVSDGQDGAEGPPGPPGADGQNGEDGQDGGSCSVTDNGDGSKTIHCEDGTSVVVNDGQDGEAGPAGLDGTPCGVSDNGDGTKTISCGDGSSVTIANGQDGASGSSCSVSDNGDGTKTISCEDGTSVTLSDGQDGQDGAPGADGLDGEPGIDGQEGQDGAPGADGADGAPGLSSLIAQSAEPAGVNCERGGVRIDTGLDLDRDGQLGAAEVQQTSYVCSAVPVEAPGDPSDPGPLPAIFPPDNPWNQDISGLPVHPSSATFIASMGPAPTLLADFGTEPEYSIPFNIVNASQPKVPVAFEYAEESDSGPYPIPADAAIEGGPDALGDRHVIVLDRDNALLYEMWAAQPDGSGGWLAGSGAIFDLSSNAVRPLGWTSADAAGLPVFPGLVRYEEVSAGEIRHALRFTAPRVQRAFILPATHFGVHLDPALPPYGLRLRLKSSVDVSAFPPQARIILQSLKTYGMFLADQGSAMYLSGAPNPQWDHDDLVTLRDIHASDFEAVDTGPIITELP